MADTGNLKPGSKVPQTGTYTCIYCGPNGMGAMVLKRAIEAMGLPYTPTGSAAKTPPRTAFQEGDTFPSCPNCQSDPSGANPTGWSLVSGETEPAKSSIPPYSGPMMEVPGNHKDGLCSDDSCPCGFPGASIPRGTGYTYVSKEVVEFRRDCPTLAEAEAKLQQIQAFTGATIFAGSGVFAPILMREQGARKRGLNLEVAANDAKRWWQTGQVPLRPTPLAGQTESVPSEGDGCFSMLLLGIGLVGSTVAATIVLLVR